MIRFFTFLFFLIALSPNIDAQLRGLCGVMPSEAMTNATLESQALLKNGLVQFKEETKYVPINFHLIADNDGNGRLLEKELFDQLCQLNYDYALNSDFVFYIQKIIRTDNTPMYNAPDSNTGRNALIAFSNNNRDGINVFVNDAIGTGASGSGIVLGRYNTNGDYILIIKGQVTSASNTLSHEIGHFFSLNHPFYGWETDPFESSDPTWPIAPNKDPWGGDTELVDGSNCSTAGDYVCDTPAEYNFGNEISHCNYTLGAKDPNGVLLDPWENLQMSYFNDCDEWVFSEDQVALMNADYSKSFRQYLHSSYVPNTTEITEEPTLVYPADESQIEQVSGIVLDWEDVPNADNYFVEFSTSKFFTQNLMQFHTTESQQEIPTLEASSNYFWRVTPYNDGNSCVSGLTSDRFKFVPGVVATSEIEAISTWSVSPNPTAGQDIHIRVTSDETLDIRVEVLSTDGRIFYATEEQLNIGNQSIIINQQGLSEGIFFIRLLSEKGTEIRKVSVSR